MRLPRKTLIFYRNYFARAIAELKEFAERFVFAIIGNGGAYEGTPYEKEVLGTLTGVPVRCLLLGQIPNNQMPDYYRAADISVLPSLMEATSLTCLESMASAVPVVATQVGGVPELISSGVDGLLVPPADPTALAEAIRRLAREPELRRTLAERARERVCASFSWNAVAKQTLRVYPAAIQDATRS